MSDFVSPEDLEAALFTSDLLTEDPVVELQAGASTWESDSQRLRGHLSVRLQFVLALLAYPGLDAPPEVLAQARKRLEDLFVEVNSCFVRRLGLSAHRKEDRPEVFRLSRLAAKWSCVLWSWERCRKVDVGVDFVRRVIDYFADVDLGEEGGKSVAPGVTSFDVVSKVTDAITRFDFLHKDRAALLKKCVDRIYEKAREVSRSHGCEGSYFDAVVRMSADVFVSAYLTEARAFRAWLLSASPEEAEHRVYVADIVGGLDMGPVYKLFDRAVDHAFLLAEEYGHEVGSS